MINPYLELKMKTMTESEFMELFQAINDIEIIKKIHDATFAFMSNYIHPEETDLKTRY